jgi:hypothetical protein
VIYPDRMLLNVPCAALLTFDGQLLADRYAISYAYCAIVLLAAQRLRQSPNRPPPWHDKFILVAGKVAAVW